MALSYYTNWGPLHHLNQELPLPPELLNFHDNYLLSDTCIDPLFDENNLFYPINETIPPPLPPPPQPQIFDSYTYPKRIKSQDNFYYHDTLTFNNNYDYFDNINFVPNPPLLPEFSPEIVFPTLEFQPSNTSNYIVMPQAYSTSSNADNINGAVISNNVNKGNGSGSLSAQSMAARLRRRKITEKTQELGKLIPGGQRMNTAEMFQAATKYIKFLQAQVGMLELMGLSEDNQENKEGHYNPHLHALVTSPLVQEKLYSAEKCLVPKKLVETLSENREIQSNPQIIKDIVQLL